MIRAWPRSREWCRIKQMLQDRFAGVAVSGIFAARRALDHAADFDPLADL